MIHNVADLAELKALAPSGVDIAFMRKRNDGDTNYDGGGKFTYNPTATDAPDYDGTIVSPNNGTGRWFRDKQGLGRAEWFGAKGNSTADDFWAFYYGLFYLGRIDLMAKTYLVQAPQGWFQAIPVAPGNRILGQGIDKTIIKLRVANEPQTNQAAVWAIGTSGASDKVVVSDLTIDCGFHEPGFSSKKVTRGAIYLLGANCSVERVKATNFGVGAFSATPPTAVDCRVIRLDLTGANPGDRIMGAIRDCVITEPGTNGTLVYPSGASPPITGLYVSGKNDPAQMAYCGRVIGNKLYDCKYQKSATPQDSDQTSPLRGISVAWRQLVEVAENEIVKFDGTGVHIQSYRDQDVVVRHNRMLDVTKGVLVSAAAASDAHIAPKITDNSILLGKYVSVPVDAGFAVQLAGITLVGAGALAEGVQIGKCYLQRNFVRGTKDTLQSLYPVGLYFAIWSHIYDNLVVEDNVLEVPDYEPGAGFGVAYENAMAFYWDYTYDGTKVRLHNNRNLAGTELRLKILGSGSTKLWGPLSTRLARQRLLHDEFIAAPTAFSLGWVSVLANGGGLVAPNGEADHPGIVRLDAAAQLDSSSSLKLGGTGVAFNGVTTHVMEALVKRSETGTEANNFLCTVGFLNLTDGLTGVYFKIDWRTDYPNRFLCVCRNATSEWSGPTLVLDDPAVWHKLRIEVGFGKGTREAVFFIDDIEADSFVDSDPGLQRIPSGALCLVAKVVRTSFQTGSGTRSLSLDYMQYQVESPS